MNKENKTIIRALNKYGKVPENWELLNQIEQLEERINKAVEYINSAIENDDIEELKSARHLLLYNEDLDKLLKLLKGENNEED